MDAVLLVRVGQLSFNVVKYNHVKVYIVKSVITFYILWHMIRHRLQHP